MVGTIRRRADRPGRPTLRLRVAAAAALLACQFVVARAQSSSASGSTTKAEQLAQDWFTSNFDDNETQLAVGVNSDLSDIVDDDVICSGEPSIQRRSIEATPNGGCPDIFTAVNASCTCLSGYADAGTWEFYVTERTSANTTYPAAMDATEVLPIDEIRTLLAPTTVTTLRIIGVGDSPQDITFVPQDQDLPGSTLPIAVNAANTNAASSITVVELVNINMTSITQSASGFLPLNTVNLTLRNCNVLKFGFDFMEGLNNVQYLDMSSNYLTAPYAGSSIQTTCSNQLCAVQILNLTNNRLSTFPEIVFNLENLHELYIAGNLITDFNISESLYQSILALDAFESDAPGAAASCTGGEWKTAHNATFCVASTSSSSSADSASSGDSNYWLYGVIAACVVVLILVGVLIRQRYLRSRRGSQSSKSFDSDGLGDTFNFDDTSEQVDSVFLNDPVIVTNRIEYKQLKVGKCISKGGFGLVFAGEVHGRRVAIKKIRPDRSNEVSEIEQFFKEIILMAQLYHPRIVDFIGVAWDVLRHLSAITEFMDAGDLRGVLHGYKQEGTRLTWRAHKAKIALHIAEALSYLHSRSPIVIHRDLKSKNVLLNMHLDAKLSDFGISRQRFRIETHMTAGIGTSFWIAPEVLLGKDYDERADIFSFGVVLSEIDTDDYPYWNDESSDVPQGKIQEAEILSLVAAGQKRPGFSDDCPAGILDLADCCLQKDPANRPSAAEIVIMLQHLIDVGLGLGQSPQQSSESPTSPQYSLFDEVEGQGQP